MRRGVPSYSDRVLKSPYLPATLFYLLVAIALMVAAAVARAQASQQQPADNTDELRALLSRETKSSSRPGTRVEFTIGQLDARLKLAPCQRIEPYVPAGTRLWGKSRVGLRCTQGPVAWNVYLPVTVKVYGRAVVAAHSLGLGQELAASDLRTAEVDLAEEHSPALLDAADAVGRPLARALAPGQTLRRAHLRARQWFAAGETVKLVAQGDGFAVASEGQALTPGIEGQAARVRTDNGRIVTGTPVGERQVEIRL
jgi:flagella basal body P-ring formation protein FlgA